VTTFLKGLVVQWNTGGNVSDTEYWRRRKINDLFPEPAGIGYKCCFYFAPGEGTE